MHGIVYMLAAYKNYILAICIPIYFHLTDCIHEFEIPAENLKDFIIKNMFNYTLQMLNILHLALFIVHVMCFVCFM